MNGLTIVITRPRAQASASAAWFESFGASVITFPVLEIEALDEVTVNELRSRARNALLNAAIVNEERVEHSIEDLLKMEGIDEGTARALASKGVGTQEQLADLDAEELIEITGMNEERANKLIMAARAPWFA